VMMAGPVMTGARGIAGACKVMRGRGRIVIADEEAAVLLT